MMYVLWLFSSITHHAGSSSLTVDVMTAVEVSRSIVM